jgi:hypothetical protein
MHEREVVGGLALVANEQTSEAIVPAVGSFDHPAARFAANAAHERRFSSTSNVWDHATIADLALGVRVVEAFVEAEIRRPTWPAWCAKYDGVERRPGHPLVVDVRGSDLDGDRDAASVRQDVAFCTEFCAIGRIGARVVPPFGAFTLALSSEHHFRSTPTRSS